MIAVATLPAFRAWPSTRAISKHQKQTDAWYQAEGARLILAVIDADRRGNRQLARLGDQLGPDVEAAISDRVKAVIPGWRPTLAPTKAG